MLNEFKHCRYIYVIRCPFDNEVIYVGCSYNPYRRFSVHCNRNNSNAPISEYIRDLRMMGIRPTMEIIHTIANPQTKLGKINCKKSANRLEKYYIKLFYNKPYSRLLNVKSIL